MPKVSVVTIPTKIEPDFVKNLENSSSVSKKMFYNYFQVLAIPKFKTIWICLVGFLLGRVFILGEIAPFGLAYFTAMAQTRVQFLPGIAFCTVVGSLSMSAYSEAAIYFIAITMFFIFTKNLKRLKYQIRAVPVFMFGAVFLARLIFGLWEAVTLYTIMVAIIEACLCLVVSYMFLYGLPVIIDGQARKSISIEAAACGVLLLSIAVAGIGVVTIFDYSIRNIIGILMIQIVALLGGIGLGTVVGVVAGTIYGIIDGNMSYYVALYAVSGMVAGVLAGIGRFAVALGYMLGSTLILLYSGHDFDVSHLLGEVAVASFLLFIIPSRITVLWGMVLNQGQTIIYHGEVVVNAICDKLAEISHIFFDLAETFNVREEEKQAYGHNEAITDLLNNVDEKICYNCKSRNICWNEKFYQSYQDVVTMFNTAAKGNLDINSVPPNFLAHCSQINNVINIIQLTSSAMCDKLDWERRILDNRQVMVEHLRAVGEIVGQVGQSVQDQPAQDRFMESILREKLAKLDCPLESVKVTGTEGQHIIEVYKQPCQGIHECRCTVLPTAAELVGEKLVLKARCGKNGKDPCYLVMHTAKKYAIVVGSAFEAKQNDTGDSFSAIPLKDGNTVLLLSDGMGTGVKAQKESFAATKYIEKLLKTGFNIELAVKTVNAMLLLRTPVETFATMDIAVINNYNGEIFLVKNGSAPSFIKSKGEVITVRSACLPMGVMNGMEVITSSYRLSPGDILVMVSDGILDYAEDSALAEKWIVNYLQEHTFINPQDIANSILKKAKKSSNGKPTDDMTVLAAILTDCKDVY